MACLLRILLPEFYRQIEGVRRGQLRPDLIELSIRQAGLNAADALRDNAIGQDSDGPAAQLLVFFGGLQYLFPTSLVESNSVLLILGNTPPAMDHGVGQKCRNKVLPDQRLDIFGH